MTRFRFIWMVLGLLAATAAASADVAGLPAPMDSRRLLERSEDANGTHLKTTVTRVTLPAGYKTPLHTHESPGPRYVLKGRLKVEESGKSQVYEAGSAFWESGQWMTAENVGEGVVELLIVEINAGPR